MAFTTEDLKAGNVDVALVDLCIGDQPVPGANFAANKMRALTDWMTYPSSRASRKASCSWPWKSSTRGRGGTGWPTPIALGCRVRFGLLHGLGLAAALSGIGLPQGEILLALLFMSFRHIPIR